ncbi:MAG: BrnT family toxin [Desulfovibrio sp.]|nr:BrnT family toxin [Desulfovibrio sp.]MBI4961312.1 BrnT family toxin [Desulfovibrio sp.]
MSDEYEFDWDPKKRAFNLRKHGLDFEDAKPLFTDTLLVVTDDRNDYDEVRYVGFGELEDIIVIVVFTLREPNIIRIISFRPADEDERQYYYGK